MEWIGGAGVLRSCPASRPAGGSRDLRVTLLLQLSPGRDVTHCGPVYHQSLLHFLALRLQLFFFAAHKAKSVCDVIATRSSPGWRRSDAMTHSRLFATHGRRLPRRAVASVPLHAARHAVCSGTLAVSRRCPVRVRHWQRNKLPGLCSADGGVEQMKKILSE